MVYNARLLCSGAVIWWKYSQRLHCYCPQQFIPGYTVNISMTITPKYRQCLNYCCPQIYFTFAVHCPQIQSTFQLLLPLTMQIRFAPFESPIIHSNAPFSLTSDLIRLIPFCWGFLVFQSGVRVDAYISRTFLFVSERVLSTYQSVLSTHIFVSTLSKSVSTHNFFWWVLQHCTGFARLVWGRLRVLFFI